MFRTALVAVATASLTLATLTVAAGPAAAVTTRYASPTGSGVACTQSNPCTLPQAVSGASDGDVVQLTADEYYLTSQLDITADDLTIQGPEGVTDSSSFLAYLIFPEAPIGVPNDQTKIRLFGDRIRFERLAITGRADGSAALVSGSGGEARYNRVRIHNSGGADTLVGDNVTLTNSVVQQIGPGSGSAVSVTGLISSSTIYSTNGTAILQANQYHATPNCSTIIVNTIAWGGGDNMLIDDTLPGSFCPSLLVDYDYSWIPATPGASSSGGIRIVAASTPPTVGTHNLPDSAALFDPTSPGDSYLSDLVLPPGSPAIDAGCSRTGSCTSHDYYGRPRPIGSENDIGAMEQSLSPVAGAVTVGDISRTTATLSASLQPRGQATDLRFQVRPVGSPTWTTAATGSQATDLFGAPTVTGSLGDLSPAVDYQARLVATSGRGESASEPASFRTLDPAPTPTPTPTPTPPTVSVTSTRVAVTRKKARVISAVTVSAAGRITQRAVSTGRRATTRGTVARSAAGAGQYRVVCTLSKKSRKELRKRSLRLAVTTRLTTPTGQTSATTKRVTLPRRR